LKQEVEMASSSGTNYHAKLIFTLRTRLQEGCAAGDFIQSISGRVFARQEAGERDRQFGSLSASLVQFGSALDHGITAEQLGDGISGLIAEYWEQMFNVDTCRWKDEIREEFEIAGSDLLIIDYVALDPLLRGHGLGLAAVRRTIEIFGSGCGLVACKPWPLQFTPEFADNVRRLKRLQPPALAQDEAVRKLRLYWSKAGFWPLGESGLFVMSMSQR
jgi:hypothetical protein